jgi:hypothetical protein
VTQKAAVAEGADKDFAHVTRVRHERLADRVFNLG